MKNTSLLSLLALSTMLTACGGGGGSGNTNIPNTTLPNTPTTPSTQSCNGPTCMITTEERVATTSINNVCRAIGGCASLSTQSINSRMRILPTASVAPTINEDEARAYYAIMQKHLINGDTSDATLESLTTSLKLAEIDLSEVPNEIKNDFNKLSNWCKLHGNEISNKAQTAWNMYGNPNKKIAADNAKLNVVNIDAKQDSFVNFIVNNGKITGLNFDVDKNAADSRSMKLSSAGGNEFTRNGPMLIYGVKLNNGDSIRLELFEKPTDINKLQNMLLARLYEREKDGDFDVVANKNEYISNAETLIKSLNLSDFKNYTEDTAPNEKAYSEGSLEADTTVIYTSYAKNINEQKGPLYSDFGTVEIVGYEGEEEVHETFVFAGGYDAKKIEKANLEKSMEFAGNAVAAVINQEYDGDDRTEQTKSYLGTSNLKFEKGKETLTANFDNFYNVKVESNNNNNYTLNLSNGNAMSNDDAKLYKFRQGDDFMVDNFVGNFHVDGGPSSYGAVDIQYFGDNNKAQETAGYVAFGQYNGKNDDGNDTELHMQIGFGADRLK